LSSYQDGKSLASDDGPSARSHDGLEIIGAGFGRTGTTSLKKALEHLGLSPCYHMQVAMTRPGHARFWIRVRETKSVDDLRQFFRNYRATVDWPACEFYRELMLAFPDAKVLLNVRDADAWYDSMRATIFAVKDALPWWFPPSILRMHDAVMWNGRLNGQFAQREAAIAAYNAHLEDVRRTVPAGRLLEYSVDQGWGPLCALLGRPEPRDIPFPRINDRKQFQRILRLFRFANWAVPLMLLAGLLVLGAVVWT
jgi:hypothetical protein